MSRSAKTHIHVIDGTLSRMKVGQETNAGLVIKLLQDAAHPDITLGYDRGIQGQGWRKWINVASGMEINSSIIAGYLSLSKRYRPGDRIMLFGYSRGAYAVRSLAGMIARIGLLRQDMVLKRRIELAFRYYQTTELSRSARVFSHRYTHKAPVNIEMIGCWDTVKALGIPFPILSRLAPMVTDFHDHHLSSSIKNAFQALALDENRTAYTPIPWRPRPGWPGRMEQVWFAGAHADIGGQIETALRTRPLSNISLVWMLDRAETCGLPLPRGWRDRFECDATAPMLGPYAGVSRFFLYRENRYFRPERGDQIHPSVAERMIALPQYHPRALGAPVLGRPPIATAVHGS